MENIPLLYGKPTHKPIINPEIKSKNRIDLKKINLSKFPENVILGFFRDFYKIIEDNFHPKIYDYHGEFKIYIFSYKNKDFAFLYPTMGSYASSILDEIISLGAKKIIFIGGVGTTSQNITRGDLIIPSKAIRDEGVSFHYEEPSTFSYPSKSLVESIEKTLIDKKYNFHKGACWTISSIYRETEEKLDHFTKLGAICVDMESASFFSVAKHRKVNIAGLFISGDCISRKKWESIKTVDNLKNIKIDRNKLIFLAIDSLWSFK